MIIFTLLFGLALIVIATLVVLALVGMVIELIKWVVKATIALTVATLGGVLVRLVAQAGATQVEGLDPVGFGLVCGLIAGATILVLIMRTSGSHQSAPPDKQVLRDNDANIAAAKRAGHIPEKTSAIAQLDPAPTEVDPQVRAAWKRAGKFLPDQSQRIGAARRDCARVLAAATGHEALDPALIDCAVLVRRQVPALVKATAALWDEAGPGERDGLAARLLASLESLAASARAQTDRRRRALADELEAVHAHVANRTGEAG